VEEVVEEEMEEVAEEEVVEGGKYSGTLTIFKRILKFLQRIRELRLLRCHALHLVPRLRKDVVAVLGVLQLPFQLFNSDFPIDYSAQATKAQPDFAGLKLEAPFKEPVGG